MVALFTQFALLSLIVIVAGTFLAQYADRLGTASKLGRSMSGILLLATATSLPELLVGCQAVMIPAVDMAVGDLLGSSLFNLLILAILDLLTRTRGNMLSRAAAAHSLSAVSSILLTGIVLLFLLDQPLFKSSWTILRLGLGSWAVLIGYLYSLRLIFFDHQYAESLAASEEALPVPSWKRPLVGYLVSAIVVFASAPRLATVGNDLANQTGLGESIFGTIFIALITSFPEVVTTFASMRMGAIDMAVGNILGSNSFNMAALVGIDLAFDGSLLSAASSAHAVTAGAVILVTAITIQGLLYRAEKRYWLIEPDALLVILIVIASLVAVYSIGH